MSQLYLVHLISSVSIFNIKTWDKKPQEMCVLILWLLENTCLPVPRKIPYPSTSTNDHAIWNTCYSCNSGSMVWKKTWKGLSAQMQFYMIVQNRCDMTWVEFEKTFCVFVDFVAHATLDISSRKVFFSQSQEIMGIFLTGRGKYNSARGQRKLGLQWQKQNSGSTSFLTSLQHSRHRLVSRDFVLLAS